MLNRASYFKTLYFYIGFLLSLNNNKQKKTQIMETSTPTIEILINEIESRISEYENAAEECYQELGNEERGNEYSAKTEELRDLLKFINGGL